MYSSLYRTKSLSPSFLPMKTPIKNLGFINTPLNEFLIKFYHGFNKHSYIFELQSLFATFESLKSVEFPMHAVVRNSNSKHFYSNASSFKIIWNSKLHCSYISCILWKMASLKRKRRLSLSERYKAITE